MSQLTKNKSLISIIGFTLGPILASCIGFITTPIITYFISPSEFGMVNTYQMFQTILCALIYLGFDQAYVRFYNEEDKNKLIINSIIIPIVLSIIIVIVLITNTEFFALSIFKDINHILPVYMLAISIPLIIIERFLLLLLRMEEKGFEYSLFNILNKALVLCMTVTFMLMYNKSYISVIYGSILAQILNDIILLIRNYNKVNYSHKLIDKNLIKKLFEYGIQLAPIDFISLMLNSIDKIAITKFVSMGELGLYSAALRITGLLGIIKNCFNSFWVPISLKWFNNGEDNEKFYNITEIILFIMSEIFIITLLFKDLIIGIFSHTYSDAKYILPFLLFYPILYTVSETIVIGINFKKKGYLITISSVISLFMNIVLNVYLVPKYGGIGAALTTGISHGIYFLLVLYFARMVWWKIPLKKIFISISILYIIAFINIFYTLAFINYINFAAAVLLAIMNINTIIKIKKLI